MTHILKSLKKEEYDKNACDNYLEERYEMLKENAKLLDIIESRLKTTHTKNQCVGYG